MRLITDHAEVTYVDRGQRRLPMADRRIAITDRLHGQTVILPVVEAVGLAIGLLKEAARSD